MCGIVGAASVSEVTEATIRVGRDTMRHRGPDAHGAWRSSDGRVGFGHRRLSVIDLSPAANQPMVDSNGDLRIVLNGEIYNYRELRLQLEGLGHRFQSASDTEVLLESFRQWGTSCVSRLNGMFAFAIYSTETRQLFLARDRAGEKPLFYYHNRGELRFCSELKALLSDPHVPREMNPEALDHYLAYGYVPGSLCILKTVQKLRPGHALTYDLETDSLKTWRYWSLPGLSIDVRSSAGDLANELEALLFDAVRLQMVADVPVGVLLSGGLDSSLITALAVRGSRQPVRTFTIVFPGHGAYDEGPHAKLVADHFQTVHTELVAEPATVDLLPELARQYDEPLGDSSMVPTYLVSKLVRQNCTVALGGDGGDELFGGYMQHSRVQAQLRLRRLMPSFLQTAVGRLSESLPIGFRGRTYLRSLAVAETDAWATSTLLLDLKARRALAPLTRSLGPVPEKYRLDIGRTQETVLRKMTATDFSTYLPDDILVKVDRASMLASLEVRAPFLDYRVIEFAFSRVPDDLRATHNERKVLLRVLAKKLLPKSFDTSRKRGFSIPMESWFKGKWGAYISDVLRSSPKTLYDPKVIERLIKGQARGFANGQRLFNLAILELWRREYSVYL